MKHRNNVKKINFLNPAFLPVPIPSCQRTACQNIPAYFLNTWEYVSDDSARQDLYADTHHYDPPGREVSVVTAKGWQRRVLYTPWFVVNEDENDTLPGNV